MIQTWVSVLGLGVATVGLLVAALGLQSSTAWLDGAESERHWAPLGLSLAGLGLMAQMFDLVVRPLIWPL